MTLQRSTSSRCSCCHLTLYQLASRYVKNSQAQWRVSLDQFENHQNVASHLESLTAPLLLGIAEQHLPLLTNFWNTVNIRWGFFLSLCSTVNPVNREGFPPGEHVGLPSAHPHWSRWWPLPAPLGHQRPRNAHKRCRGASSSPIYRKLHTQQHGRQARNILPIYRPSKLLTYMLSRYALNW